jgi:hypothetical protein
MSLGIVKEIDLNDILPISTSKPSYNPQPSSIVPMDGLELLANKPVVSPIQTQSNSFNGGAGSNNLLGLAQPSVITQPQFSTSSSPQIQIQRHEQDTARISGQFDNILGSSSIRDMSNILNTDFQQKSVGVKSPTSSLLTPNVHISTAPNPPPLQRTNDTFFPHQATTSTLSLGGQGGNASTSFFSTSATDQTHTQNQSTTSVPSEEDIQKEKQDLLFRLQRLSMKGVPVSRRYTMNHTLAEIKEEYVRLKSQRDLDMSVKFQKKMMTAFATGVEFLNAKFDPFDIKLDGWSESVHENSDEYDDIFEELHEKYKDRAKMAPEFRLALGLASSAFMYHMMQSFWKSSPVDMSDVMRENPQLAKQVGQAAFASASKKQESSGGLFGGGGIGSFMSDLFGGSGGTNTNSVPSFQPKTKTDSERTNDSSEGTFRGPSGVDNILNSLARPPQQSSRVSSGGGNDVRNIEVSRRTTKTPSFNRGISLDI